MLKYPIWDDISSFISSWGENATSSRFVFAVYEELASVFWEIYLKADKVSPEGKTLSSNLILSLTEFWIPTTGWS